MDSETFFKKLKTPISDEQKAIITADEKPTAVIASAGSGKTTTLINRILYQIEVKGIEPEFWQLPLVKQLNKTCKKGLMN